MPIRTLAYLLESGETPEVIRADHRLSPWAESLSYPSV
jgi:hypothetical protein